MKHLHRVRKSFNRLRENKDGNIAIMTALTALGLVGIVGFAIDTSGARNAKQVLQSHLDVVSLAVATSGLTEAEEQKAYAQKVLKSQGYDIADSKLNILMLPNGEVSVTGNVEYATIFAGVWGKEDMKIGAQSVAIAGAGTAADPTDIVLVLDTTESMEGAKLTALQSSANKLVEVLTQANSEQVQIGLVPFSGYVNVGMEHREAFWIDVEPDQVVIETEIEQILVSEGYCRGNPNAILTKIEDGVPVTYTGCDDYVEAVYMDGQEITKTSERVWEGCVLSRSRGDDSMTTLHLRDDEWVNEPVSGYSKSDWMCGNPIIGLTSELENISAGINAIEAEWDTYMPGGIAWGWSVLSPHEPFTGGQTSSKQIMVLMTDGVNSMYKQGRAHAPSDPNNAETIDRLDKTNQDTATLCQNVKNDNIEIYTIAFEVNDPVTRSILSSCATSTANFFEANNAQQLEDAFLKIAGSITTGVEVRLTR